MDMEIKYIERNGFFYPDLKLPEQTNYAIGKYGLMHRDYLKAHRKGTYTSLLMNGTLNRYLHEIDVQAREMVDCIVKQLAEECGIDEDLKARDELKWVREMNNIRDTAEEIVVREVIEK